MPNADPSCGPSISFCPANVKFQDCLLCWSESTSQYLGGPRTGRLFTAAYAVRRRRAGRGGSNPRITSLVTVTPGYAGPVTSNSRGEVGSERLGGGELGAKSVFGYYGIRAVESGSSPVAVSTGYAGWRPGARFLAGWRGRLRVSPIPRPCRNGRFRRRRRQAWRAAPVRGLK